MRKTYAEVAKTVDDAPINGTLSAGVSTYTPGGDLGAILRRADTALYTAKTSRTEPVVAIAGHEPATTSNVVRVA